MNHWNNLPDELVTAGTQDSFKKSPDAYLGIYKHKRWYYNWLYFHKKESVQLNFLSSSCKVCFKICSTQINCDERTSTWWWYLDKSKFDDCIPWFLFKRMTSILLFIFLPQRRGRMYLILAGKWEFFYSLNSSHPKNTNIDSKTLSKDPGIFGEQPRSRVPNTEYWIL